ncbi:MAG: protein kinase [Planctomycetota bacterium]
MNERTCHEPYIESLLDENCPRALQKDLEQHLENCPECRQRLFDLAADDYIWAEATSMLSTVGDIRLSAESAQKIKDTTSFLVSRLDTDPELPDHSAPVGYDWTKILDPPAHPEAVGRIDQFEMESKLGQGGMGIVLKGFDRELNRAVAIKILAPHLAANGTARKRFAREAQAAAAVVHPNVTRIYSVKQSPQRPYIVMELGPTESLQNLVDEHGPLDVKNVIRIGLQIASGLSAAHKIGLIHRDIKPGNILVEKDVSRVMITDFGLARAVDDVGMTQTGWLTGTPNYMSPEQARGEELDTRSDLFSLGSLLYFLATGREPFRGEKTYAVIQNIIHEHPVDPRSLNSEVPKYLADLIQKLLEKDPGHRFEDANHLSNVLEKYLAYLEQPGQMKPPKRIVSSRTKQKQWIAAGIASFVLASTASWLLLFKQPIQPAENPDKLSTKTETKFPTEAVSILENPVEEPEKSILELNSISNEYQFDDFGYFQELGEIKSRMKTLESQLLAPNQNIQGPGFDNHLPTMPNLESSDAIRSLDEKGLNSDNKLRIKKFD